MNPRYPVQSFPYSALYQWYEAHGRHTLPWRLTDDPYRIYVSEIMLQQTQVATVLERFYDPFLNRFPTLQALAHSALDDVLKMWEGLGYYSRARHLHRAAQQCAPDLPTDIDGLMALPGIGRNTAHAIAAFAYHQPVAVLEANVKRVVARLAALKSPKETEWWDVAGALVESGDPYTYNQAMMDIGSLICTPKAPDCPRCPLQPACLGKEEPLRYPQRKAKKTVPVRRRWLFVVTDEAQRFWVAPRRSRFLSGLYGFPEWDLDGQPPAEARCLGEVRQTYSHFMLDGTALHLPKEHADAEWLADESGQWVTLEQAWQLPMSRADHKVLRLIEAYYSHSH